MPIKYAMKMQPTEDQKLAKTPQVKVILKHLSAKPLGHEHERETLVDSMDKDPEFVSKQGAAKILNFYIPKLVEAGIVEKIGSAAEDKPAKEDKPVKEKKASAKAKAAEAKAEAEDADELEDGESDD